MPYEQPTVASEWVLAHSKGSYPDDFIDALRGGVDDWALLGLVNLRFPPSNGEYFMRFNTRGWGHRDPPENPLRRLQAVHPKVEVLWHNPSKVWVVVGVDQEGGNDGATDLLKVLAVCRQIDNRVIFEIAEKIRLGRLGDSSVAYPDSVYQRRYYQDFVEAQQADQVYQGVEVDPLPRHELEEAAP